MKLPFLPRRENRQANFTDAIVQRIIEGAQAVEASAQGTGALEIAAGVVGRAFASADVSGTDRLTPDILAHVGRDLIRQGESLAILEDGELVLVGAWTVTGQSATDWRYSCDVPAPDGTRTFRRRSAQVMHPRYSVDRTAPWQGVGPLARASLTAGFAARLEASLGDETLAPVGYLLPIPADGDDESVEALKADLRTLKGRTAMVETTSAGWGEGRGAAPRDDWQPRRLGPVYSPSSQPLYRDTVNHVLAACGVPVELVLPSDGTGQREAWRRFLHGTVQPLARIVEAEAGKLFSRRVSLSFERLFASDIAGRARAFQSLVGSGMSVEEAAAQTGLLAEDGE